MHGDSKPLARHAGRQETGFATEHPFRSPPRPPGQQKKLPRSNRVPTSPRSLLGAPKWLGARLHQSLGPTRHCGEDGYQRARQPRSLLTVQNSWSPVCLGSCKASPMQTGHGRFGGERKKRLANPLVCPAASSVGWGKGLTSAWHAVTISLLTATRYSKRQNCHGQQLVGLDEKTHTLQKWALKNRQTSRKTTRLAKTSQGYPDKKSPVEAEKKVPEKGQVKSNMLSSGAESPSNQSFEKSLPRRRRWRGERKCPHAPSLRSGFQEPRATVARNLLKYRTPPNGLWCSNATRNPLGASTVHRTALWCVTTGVSFSHFRSKRMANCRTKGSVRGSIEVRRTCTKIGLGGTSSTLLCVSHGIR